MAKIDYGIEEIMICKLAANGTFPKFDTVAEADKITIQMIDIDSVELVEEDNSSTELEFENAETLTLSGTKGRKLINFTSSNKEDKVAKFLKGMEDGTGTDDTGYLVEDPDHDDSGTYAMRIKTKALGDYPAKIKEYTPVLVAVKANGTIGKNNIGKYSFSCVRQPNFDATGKKIGGYREKSIPSA